MGLAGCGRVLRIPARILVPCCVLLAASVPPLGIRAAAGLLFPVPRIMACFRFYNAVSSTFVFIPDHPKPPNSKAMYLLYFKCIDKSTPAVCGFAGCGCCASGRPGVTISGM
jgi:hypothetical protein